MRNNTGYIENSERVMDAKLVLSIVAAAILSFTGIVVETSMNVAFPVLMEEFHTNLDTNQNSLEESEKISFLSQIVILKEVIIPLFLIKKKNLFKPVKML